MFALLGYIIGGAITGGLARAVMPGTQNIGWPKTIGVGIAANVVVGLTVGLIFGTIISFIAAVAAGVGILSFSIQKGWLNPGSNQPKSLP